MNERIKELVEQAFIITTDGKIGHVNNYMVEKFAKLIVKECIGALDQDDGATYHGELLLEHFGVEE